MYCSQCGKEVKSGSRFCPGCGAPVGTAKPTPDQVPDIGREAGLSKETAKQEGRSQQQEEPGAKSKTEPVAEELDVNQVTAPRPVDLTIALDCGNIKTKSWDLFIFDVVTKNITQLTSFPAHENHPTWSPDGKRIAFSSNMDDPNYRTCSAAIGDEHCNNEIYVIDVDGTNLTRLTFNDADDGSPSWAP